jgi:hypothetical protein
MYFGEYYIAAQEVTSNYVCVLYYILCVDKDYIFSKVKFYLTRLCSCISTLPRFGASKKLVAIWVNHKKLITSVWLNTP